MKKISIVLASWPIREPLDKCWKTPSPYECMPDMILSAGVVKRQFLKINIDKASGPDLVPATKFSVTSPQNSPFYSLPFSNNFTIRELCHIPGGLPIIMPSLKRAPKLILKSTVR